MPGLFGGGSKSTKETPQESALTSGLTTAETGAINTGTTTAASGTSALTSALKFFQTLLSGDRTAIATAEAPAIESLTSQYEAGEKAESQFAPRGGGRTAADEELRFGKEATIDNLITGAITEGATGTADIGGILAQLGISEEGLGISGGNATLNTLENQREFNVQDQEAQQVAAGQAVGSLLALLPV